MLVPVGVHPFRSHRSWHVNVSDIIPQLATGVRPEGRAPPLSTGAYILELMSGARNLVRYANLAPGEEVVLAVGTQVDPIVTQAVLAALSGQPVTITTVVVPDPGPLFHEIGRASCRERV